MKTIVALLTMAVFALSIPVAMAKDLNRDALQQAWKAQQVEQEAAKKKAEEALANMTINVEPGKLDTKKTK